MKILITGGSGFIGTNLIDYYLSKGIEVANIDIAPPKINAHESYWRKINILDKTSLFDEVVKYSPTHIINLAATTGMNDKDKTLEDFATNIQGILNIINSAKTVSSLERIIFISSMAVCRIGYQPQNETDYCPDSLYGESKMLGEKLIRQAGTLPYSWIIVRPTGIWGPWSHEAYNALFKLIQRGLYIHPAGVSINYSLGFVGNAVYQLDKLLQAPSHKIHGKSIYLADSPPIDMRVWTNLAQKTFGAPRIHEMPIWILKVMAAIGDILTIVGWKYPPLTSPRLENMLTTFVFDLNPILTENLPYELEEAVQITVDWICNKKLSTN
ncbi:NAD-dependent epimerase/dehydratase family protein [Chloroflexota bacterium]